MVRPIFIVYMLLSLPWYYLDGLAAVNDLLSFDDCVQKIYERQNIDPLTDFESTKQLLQEAYATPLDLNKITPEALASLAILSEKQLANFFNHIAATGPLYSKYELQAIPGFDLATIALLLPFVYVVESYDTPLNPLCKQRFTPEKGYLLLRYSPSFDKPSSPLPLGGLDAYMVQFSLKSSSGITVGVTARKQAGEAFTWDHATHRYGFNLWSIYLILDQKSYLKRILIGDYQVGYGQGILLGFPIKNGSDIVSVFRAHHNGIRPYKGIRRIGFRGLAFTTTWRTIELTGFYSTHNLDAKIASDEANNAYAARIDPNGRYDTLSNLNKKGTIRHQVVGCTMATKHHNNQREVGINVIYSHYDRAIRPKTSAWSRYLFKGQEALSTGLFYRWLWHNLLFFGELGINLPIALQTHQSSCIGGFVLSLTRYCNLSMATYYYGRAFHSPYGGGFKYYTTDNANEKGIYGGIQVIPCYNWQILTQGHFFATLRPKSSLVAAGSGYVFDLCSTYIRHRITTYLVAYKLSKVPKNPPRALSLAYKNKVKFKLDHKLTPSWWMGLEGQYLRYIFLKDPTHGYALSHTQKWKGTMFQFSLRGSYFNAPAHSVSPYLYEPNPLYHGTQFKPYLGQGIAMSGLFCWKPLACLRVELKYNYTYFIKQIIKQKSWNRYNQKGCIQCIGAL
ncbi:MAG: helix-hairpin-helix domain-containing protein [Amoebophilaceae bacterium]|nr:helix-hairpin-helix domain-containing protein [Amoebophilaceae bacterium]